MKGIAPYLGLLVGAVTRIASPGQAQGGPPFRSDDPDTPGNRRWEINAVFIGDRTASEGSYSAPNLDVNYGLGSRLQFKYEVPLALREFRDSSGKVLAGVGNSLLGIKWRFYAHHPVSNGQIDKKESNFGLSVYPQFLVSNSHYAVRRDIVEPGPQFLIPVEANARIGPLRISAEVGCRFAPKDVPNAWTEGVIVGHELQNKTDLYIELYDERATRETPSEPKTRETTIGIGFRAPPAKGGLITFIGMVGRSVAAVTQENGQPNWIASFGIQVLTGKRRRNSSDSE